VPEAVQSPEVRTRNQMIRIKMKIRMKRVKVERTSLMMMTLREKMTQMLVVKVMMMILMRKMGKMRAITLMRILRKMMMAILEMLVGVKARVIWLKRAMKAVTRK
jgi:hypothetical protein